MCLTNNCSWDFHSPGLLSTTSETRRELERLEVKAIPGPCSLVAALSASGSGLNFVCRCFVDYNTYCSGFGVRACADLAISCYLGCLALKGEGSRRDPSVAA